MNKKELEEIGNNVLGTCDDISEPFCGYTTEQWNIIEAIARKCWNCGWWCEPVNFSDDGHCPDCQEEE